MWAIHTRLDLAGSGKVGPAAIAESIFIGADHKALHPGRSRCGCDAHKGGERLADQEMSLTRDKPPYVNRSGLYGDRRFVADLLLRFLLLLFRLRRRSGRVAAAAANPGGQPVGVFI